VGRLDAGWFGLGMSGPLEDEDEEAVGADALVCILGR
jgi:hypothetical protein